MFRNLEAEQRRAGMTNTDVAEYLGVSRATYENKKKDGKFTRPEIVKLLRLFNCKFEYRETPPRGRQTGGKARKGKISRGRRGLDRGPRARAGHGGRP